MNKNIDGDAAAEVHPLWCESGEAPQGVRSHHQLPHDAVHADS